MSPEQLRMMLNSMIIPQLQSMTDEDFIQVRATAMEVLFTESERRGLVSHSRGFHATTVPDAE